MTKNKILLIDGNSVAFRAFFAMHSQLEKFKNAKGLHTNAIYAFHLMLDNVLEKIKPTHVLVAFDAGKKTFRTAIYPEYKAGRKKMPSEFSEQLPFIRKLLEARGISWYELLDYEADDILGTLTRRTVQDKNFEVVILSGDRDLTQLTSDKVSVEITKKGVAEIEEYTPAHIMEKFGLTPDKIVDMKALMGDASDNIPGVTKIGEKTALRLLHEYGSLEGVYENFETMKASKMKENLVNDKELAFLSKKLATINQDAPVEMALKDTVLKEIDHEKLVQFYKEMDFNSFLTKYLGKNEVVELVDLAEIAFQVVEEVTAEMLPKTGGTIVVEMLRENYHTEPIIGLAWGDAEKIYVAKADILHISPIFKDWLENETIPKKVFDGKAACVALNRYNIELSSVKCDLLIASYLLDTNEKILDVASIAHHYGYEEVIRDEAVYGKGAKRSLPKSDEELYDHLARKVMAIENVAPGLEEQLAQKEQLHLLTEMELPLSFILAKMELAGITVKATTLQEMKGEIAGQLQEFEQAIYEKAGEVFNINSPKQLGVILFEKMGYVSTKKTKTGYSTAVDVLEKMRRFAPIVDDILNYRQLAKLQSTYVEGLLKVIGKDQKVHTRYLQTLTQTGRLSSIDPNLQNIPVRLEYGRLIRKAFVPSQESFVIYSADYSQIELRVLAHISGDKHLCQAFSEGADIHTRTAMRILGIEDEKDVTKDLRRRAKAVNFGVVYGISDYGLSQNLGIYRKEAQEFIDRYFEKYPGVKRYMEEIVQKAKLKGYVETLYKRRRYLPEINSKNFNLRSFAERMAINSPIQGSAADILKLAMIEMDKQLKLVDLKARMLLQVHDELVFEVASSEVVALDRLVKRAMEHTVKLRIPLVVDSHWGDTWFEAK
ncbi:MAG: DNA polymerase I [Streptococcaceae bacterium]|jgi:DNA polymerase-1|nr:DNA polymerase I [Streptococcaceae bacterium]